jgi:hypothetical protein
VQAAVVGVFGSLNPRDDISFEKLSELTLQVRKKIEGDSEEDRKYVPLLLSIILGLLLTVFFEGTESGCRICSLLGKRKTTYWKSLAFLG